MANLNTSDIRHLLTRTGFTPSEAEVSKWAGRTREEAVVSLVNSALANIPNEPPPSFEYARPIADKASNDPQRVTMMRQELRQEQNRQGVDLKVWWAWQMLTTANPLTERMTLFWHSHFATSQRKVVRAKWMWDQHEMLRKNALGGFDGLLRNIVRDPAMLFYLDNQNNRKDAPNENLGRELLELFSLGEASSGGGYTERDIKEAARALTGHSVDGESGEFRFRPALHDTGSKTILGKTGNFNGDSLIDVILRYKTHANAPLQVALHITRKLWEEFVSPITSSVHMATLTRLAHGFAKHTWSVAWLMQEMLLTREFWDPINRGVLVKSPIELLVGIARQFQFAIASAHAMLQKAAQLGHNLLVPPNVKGWSGGNTWINATTLLERKRTTEALFRGNNMGAEMGVNTGVEKWLASYGARLDSEPSEGAKEKIQIAMLALPPVQPVPVGTVGIAYVRALTLDPVFQLK